MAKSNELYDIEEIKDLEEKFLNATEKSNYLLALREVLINDERYDDLTPFEKEFVPPLMEMLQILGSPVTEESYERFIDLMAETRERINKLKDD